MAILSSLGLIKIPFVSEFFYKEPERIVEPDLKWKENLEAQLKQTLLKTEKEKKMPQTIELTITQEQATGLLNEYQKEIGKGLPIKDFEVIIKPEFLILREKIKGKLLITASLYPKIENEKVEVKIKNIKIGSLPLPNFLLDWGIDYLKLKTGEGLSYPAFGIKSLKLKEGELIVLIAPEALEKLLKP